MKPSAQQQLIQTCIDNIDAGITQMSEGEYFSPTSRYTDKHHFERELERVFKRNPVLIAHISDFDDANYLTRDVFGTPVLLTRDESGQYRAFVNACRHRGVQLVGDESGCKRRFTCPYHGWMYNQQGELKGVPDAQGFPSLDKSKSGLKPLPLWQQEGFLWTMPDANHDFDFKTFWQPLADELDHYHIQDMVSYGEETSLWAGNWKLFVEGGIESYHFNVAHAKTIASFFHNNASLCDALLPHFRMLIPKANIGDLKQQPKSQWRLQGYTHMVYQLFPMCALLIQEDHIAMFIMKPVAVDQTEVTFKMLIPRDSYQQKPESYWQLNHKITRDALHEDFAMAEAIQRGISSGHIEQLRFGRFEHALGSFNELVADMIDEKP